MPKLRLFDKEIVLLFDLTDILPRSNWESQKRKVNLRVSVKGTRMGHRFPEQAERTSTPSAADFCFCDPRILLG